MSLFLCLAPKSYRSMVTFLKSGVFQHRVHHGNQVSMTRFFQNLHCFLKQTFYFYFYLLNNYYITLDLAFFYHPSYYNC